MKTRKTSVWLVCGLCGLAFTWPATAQNATASYSTAKVEPSSQAHARKASTFEEFVDATIAQERRLAKLMRFYKPIIETYIQEQKTELDQTSPKDDVYFLSR